LRTSIGLHTEEDHPALHFPRNIMSVKSFRVTSKKESLHFIQHHQANEKEFFNHHHHQGPTEEEHQQKQKNIRFRVGSIEIYRHPTEGDFPKEISPLLRKSVTSEENIMKPRFTVKEKRKVKDSLNPKKLKEKMNSKIRIVALNKNLESPCTTKNMKTGILHTMY